MKTNFIFAALCLSCWIISCTTPSEEEKKVYALAGLELLPHPDTLYLSPNETRTLNLRGMSVNTSQQTTSNSGVITDVTYTVTTTDTTTQSIPPGDATWSSSNTGVATVSQGVVIAHNPGTANISATVSGVATKPLPVNVKAVNTAPGLSLDPPQTSVTFKNSITVSGNVQQLATLIITESSSGHNNTNVSYDANGKFSENITGFITGYRTITATARNPAQTNLSTTRYKYVYYYQYLSPQADSICGDWIGTTLGKDFGFNISKSIIFSRYDINGHIDIQFEGIGVVRDITLTGVVNNDGTIDASLSKSYEGFSISGSFTGYFKTIGTGEGSYRAGAKKSGWPTLSGSADWTAVKKP
jgi:hypothetical protein